MQKPLVVCERENLWQETKNTLEFGSGSHHGKHVHQVNKKLDNKHRENSDLHECMSHERIHKKRGQLCPIKSLQRYISQRSLKQRSLWQRPKKAGKILTLAIFSIRPTRCLQVAFGELANLLIEYTNRSIPRYQCYIIQMLTVSALITTLELLFSG